MSHSIEQGELPYDGRVGVFYGGSGGTGLVAAVEYQKLGGEVWMGASSESTYKRGLANVRILGGDRTRVKPLIGSVSDTGLLLRNIGVIVETQKKEGKPVTDIFSFAATGMPFALEFNDDFLVPMNRIVAENPPNRDELLEVKKAELRRKYAIWLPDSRDDALAVNYTAKVNIIIGFFGAYKGKIPLSFVDFNSRFGKEGVGPGFYGNVLTKHDFSVEMEERADEYAQQGMDTAEFTSDVVEDTDVGKSLLNKVVPLLKPELGAMMVRTKIRRINVFEGMRGFLEMTREERAIEGHPYERYILGDEGKILVVKSVPDELKMNMGLFDM